MDTDRKPTIFGSYGSSDPSMNVPVTSSAGSVMSPYLNFDPAILTTGGDSDFIFPEGASHQRGRFELAFSQIGGSVFLGGAVGGVRGFYNGLRETKELTGPVKRTQMLNFITKRGASMAQAVGVVALMYSIFGVVISKVRGADDELNTLAAGTATGLLYKSSAGWRAGLKAGGVGLGLSAVYCLLTSRDRIKQILHMED